MILLDVKMPEMDGFETAALIRQRDKSRHTPIIFLTAGRQSQTQAVRGYAVGAVDYLVKPVVPEFVRSKVAVFVELAKKTELLRRQTELLQASEQEARELAETRAELVRDLEHKNRELESFSYAVSHDLRAPLRRIESFSRAVQESQGERLDADGPALPRARARGQPADVAADRRRALPRPGHPRRDAGAGGGPERAGRRCCSSGCGRPSRTGRWSADPARA